MESRRDRLTTIRVLPLLSCGARLPIYALFIPAFFPPAWHTPLLWSIYMIGAFAAKEVFVAQLGIVNAVGEAHGESQHLRSALREQYTRLQAFCILLFCLISVPCMVTLVTAWKETGSWKCPALQLGGLTALAYVITFTVYQVGSLLA